MDAMTTPYLGNIGKKVRETERPEPAPPLDELKQYAAA